MPVDTWKSLQARISKYEKTFTAEGRTKIALEAAKLIVPLQDAVVRASPLGGKQAFSHWKRGNEIKVATKPTPKGNGVVVIGPATRQAAGPWTVANTGRKGYAAGDRRVSGSYTSKKTGQVKQRTRKVKRTNAGHGGWNVQDQAVEVVVREGPRLIAKAEAAARVAAFDL